MPSNWNVFHQLRKKINYEAIVIKEKTVLIILEIAATNAGLRAVGAHFFFFFVSLKRNIFVCCKDYNVRVLKNTDSWSFNADSTLGTIKSIFYDYFFCRFHCQITWLESKSRSPRYKSMLPTSSLTLQLKYTNRK